MHQSGFLLINNSDRGDCEKRLSQQDIKEESVFLSSVSEEQRRKDLGNSPVVFQGLVSKTGKKPETGLD